ncbi:BRO-N domain-containing protein [Psychrobacter sp. AOP5-GZ1-6]|uniref:BRO-N domain-containing protein n=1 Tax=Psychrobacter sp. AOP5-GZ1-6 TaxID=3457649 RepID=UPI00402BF316
MNNLTFNDVNFNPVEQNGQIWLTSKEIAKALGYKNSTSINKLYNANADEFSDNLSQVIETTVSVVSSKTKGLRAKIRIFSLRGCHLLAMFARTDIAKQFRKWVLDILDKEVGAPAQAPNQLSTTVDRKPLVDAVNMHCKKSGAIYSDIWKMVHQRFNVDDVECLTVEQVPQAVEYIHSYSLKATMPATPISSFTHNQYIMNVKGEIMDYVDMLRKIVVAGGNTLPKYPEFDTEEICQAFIVSMIRHNRMMLNFDHNGKPVVGFIPDEHAVVSSESIASVVQFADKKQLPSIINEAVKRLGQ